MENLFKKKLKIHCLELKGTPKIRGIKSGKLFKDILQREILKFQHYKKNQKLIFFLNKIKKKVYNTFPDYIEEIEGRAEGANVDSELYFLMLCPELLGIISGCTSILYIRFYFLCFFLLKQILIS